MANIDDPHRDFNSTAPSTGNHAGWRRYWAAVSNRAGSDWPSLISLHFDICNRLQAARVSS